EAESLISGTMFNSMNDLLILRELRVKGKSRKVPIIIEVIWRPPPLSWIKVNTDGSTYGSSGSYGYSGVFQTHRGFIRGCFSILLGTSYAFEAKLTAAIYAINFAWKYGWKHLWLENDSVYIVSLLLARSLKVPFRWKSTWCRTLRYITNMKFVVTHIYREGNRHTDSLSSRIPSFVSPIWWWSATSFSFFVNDDYIAKFNYRFY
ncbi:Ribonuclease H, partial [Parasponia andersonii]